MMKEDFLNFPERFQREKKNLYPTSRKGGGARVALVHIGHSIYLVAEYFPDHEDWDLRKKLCGS